MSRILTKRIRNEPLGSKVGTIEISTGETFTAGRPKQLFRDPNLVYENPTPNYDVSPDGERFVLVEPIEGGEPGKMVIVQNWYEEFRDRGQD